MNQSQIAPRNLDLDTDAPENVQAILRRAAEQYRESASELQSAWQDRNAGKVWDRIARILERAADQVEKTID
jgi:hypothetical protein